LAAVAASRPAKVRYNIKTQDISLQAAVYMWRNKEKAYEKNCGSFDSGFTFFERVQ
jgi:hypothetical protein